MLQPEAPSGNVSRARVRISVCDCREGDALAPANGQPASAESGEPGGPLERDWRLTTFGACEMALTPAAPALLENNLHHAWLRHGTLIRLNVGAAAGGHSAAAARVVFEDLEPRRVLERMVDLTPGTTIVLRHRIASAPRALAVILTATGDRAPANAFTSEFRTEFFTVSSTDRWIRTGPDEAASLTLHGARVEGALPNGETWTLTADTVACARESPEVRAERAVLADGAGRVLATGEHLKVWVEGGQLHYSSAAQQSPEVPGRSAL